MIPTLKQHEDFLTRRQAERGRVEDESHAARTRERKERDRAVVLESARDVVNAVLLVTQEQVRQHVEDICTLALSLVYGDDYAFELSYEVKRNQTEITPWIVHGGQRVSPRDSVGGGVVDVCSLALRLAMWSMMEPQPAPVFILDEPGRFVSRDKQPLFGAMLKQLAELLGIQIIMVSHASCIMDQADVAYEVTQNGGVSRVERVKGAGQ